MRVQEQCKCGVGAAAAFEALTRATLPSNCTSLLRQIYLFKYIGQFRQIYLSIWKNRFFQFGPAIGPIYLEKCIWKKIQLRLWEGAALPPNCTSPGHCNWHPSQSSFLTPTSVVFVFAPTQLTQLRATHAACCSVPTSGAVYQTYQNSRGGFLYSN